MISSLFDPLGFAASVILTAKLLLQESCRKRLGWDEEIDEADFQRWRTCLEELSKLKSIEIPRCLSLKGANYPLLTCMQLHHFADASSSG